MAEDKIFILDEKDKAVIDQSLQKLTADMKTKAATDLSNVTEDALTNLGAAPAEHSHDMSDFNEVVSVDKGGTGANIVSDAIENLGVYSKEVVNAMLGGKADSTHTHGIATSDTSGFMSSTDKAKLDTFPTKIIIHKGTATLPDAVKGAILIAYDA